MQADMIHGRTISNGVESSDERVDGVTLFCPRAGVASIDSRISGVRDMAGPQVRFAFRAECGTAAFRTTA
ncbi:hypothetical protein C2L64_46570 [Paraburkholderia hospita]|uniref:Uncharacterized protein n=1 Tax=Paraburkholderia hospita TaxID=169430 RepID=A0AAN1JKZ0_9BURK|nr:hypothetical protein C2L64_46570 [Paraburkholderia hospita]